MAGMLSRIVHGDSGGANTLGLSSRYFMPTDVRRERDREIGKSVARTQVIETDIRGLEHVGGVAINAMASISAIAEAAAMRLPEERQRVDSVADMVAVTLSRKVAELGG